MGPQSETPWATSCVTKRYDWSRPPHSSPRPKRSSGTTTILVPASSTLHRVVGEQRALARQQLYVRLLAGLPSSMPADLDALVQVEETPYSPLHALKAPPGLPSPRALLRLIAKLDQIQATQVLTLDLTWLNPNLQKALAQHVWQASAHRLRGLPAPQRYTVLVCFLTQTYRDTLDQLVDMYSKVVTATYRRAQHDLDTAVKQHRTMFRDTLQSFHTIGQMLFDDTVAPDAVRTDGVSADSPGALAAATPGRAPVADG